PEFPHGQSATTTGYFRYEDCTQDGRLIPLAIPPALGGLWREVLVHHPGARNALAAGVIPILTRLTLTSFDQPIRVDRPFESTAGFLLAHDRQGDEVSRIFMNVWADTRGAAGKLSRHVTPGELAPAGTIFAEHTFTRLMAPPDQRKVTRLAVDGYPEIPETRYAAPAPTTAQEAPEGAAWISDVEPDTTDYVFTLDQTDSNQHVNSLVYIRLFLEAVNRRLAKEGQPLRVRSRAVDIAYRKPCFAGDRVRAHVRLFQGGAAGHVAGDDGKPRCYVRTILAP
ncbi:MAG TPA: hypothetical protein VLT45_12355, partial [Kofleriaceae bacterium]|nr:hypothetical protein [Kofleriaceae bacterium]